MYSPDLKTRESLNIELQKLAKAQIKLKVLNAVQEKIDLELKYGFIFKFKTVPKACKYYKNYIDTDYDVYDEKINDILEAWLLNQTIIYKYEPPADDSLKKKHFRTWVGNEKKRIEKTS